MKKRFLVCYDYGQGGVWALVSASSAAAIRTQYPELDVADGIPEWVTLEVMTRWWQHTYDLDAPPSGMLARLIQSRESK